MSELEREKFEKWATSEEIDLSLCKVPKCPETAPHYWSTNTTTAWRAWLARSESAPADLRRAWEQGRDAASEIAHQWATSKSCDQHSDNPCCHVRTGAGIFYKIVMLEWSGESAPATHDNLSCAVCGKGMELVSGDPRAFYKCSSCGSDPELTAGEAGSPAPAPTYVGVDFGRGKDATGYHCSVCGDSLEPCEHWVKFEAAPAEEIEPPICEHRRLNEDGICRKCGMNVLKRAAPAPTEEK